MTSGASATSSAAYLRVSAALPADQRASMCTLLPSIQPNSCSACWNAVRRARASGSLATSGKSTPMRRTGSGCCARAASGQTAAAPPISVMKSRRLIGSPDRGPRWAGQGIYNMSAALCITAKRVAQCPFPVAAALARGGRVRCTPKRRRGTRRPGRHLGHEPPPAPQQFRVALMDSCQRDVPKSRLLQWAAMVLSAGIQASSFRY